MNGPALDRAQTAAATSPADRLLVIAGPGSGKTRTIAGRVAYHLACGVPPWRLLAVTFTNRAADELRSRLPDSEGLWSHTFHAACARILSDRRGGGGVPDGFTVADPASCRRLLAESADAQAVEAAGGSLRHLVRAVSRHKTGGDGTAAVAQTAAAYTEALRQRRQVDFDDLLVAVDRLASDPAAGVDRLFDAVVVDEFQDTSPIQYRLLLRLARYGQLTCVGDPDQAIYAFRGAAPAVVERFLDDHPDGTVVTLDTNYRSSRQIVAAAAGLASGRHAAAVSGDGPAPQVIRAADDRDEAATAAGIIAARDGSRAVLARTHWLLAPVEAALVSRGVAARSISTRRLTDRPDAAAALAWMTAAVNPADLDAVAVAVKTPRRGIGTVSWQSVLAFAAAQRCDPVAALEMVGCADDGRWPARMQRSARAFCEDYRRVAEACRSGPATAVAALVDLWGSAVLTADSAALLRAAAEGHPDTLSFVRAAAMAVDDADGTAEVELATIHAAKGREYDHVVVVGCDEGLIPHRLAVDADEERRLLYVAATRARRSVTFLSAGQRQGRLEPAGPSPLLERLAGSVRSRTEAAASVSVIPAGRRRRGPPRR